MKLTKLATEQLLQSIRLLSHSDFVQVSDITQNNYERCSVGELNGALVGLDQFYAEDFVLEVEHIIEDTLIAVSLTNPQRLLISIQKHRKEQTEHRRQHIKQTNNGRQVALEIFSLTQFPAWLLALAEATEQNSQRKREQEQFLHLCCSLFRSISIFTQFHLLTIDSLTKLQSRIAMQRTVDEKVKLAGMNLCMIHCRDFQIVNRKFGQAKGDQVLNEIATIINHHTRSGDLACRFGGALFGIASHANSVEEGLKLAQKLQSELHNRPYLQNAIRLTFNVGVSRVEKEDCMDVDSSASSVLISRAEQALKAAQTSDKPSIVHWEADEFSHDEQDFNYIGGIFTPDNVTNYRNMLLLWDISSIIADEHEFSRLLINVVERLAYSFEFSAAGIIADDASNPVEQAVAISEMAEVSPLPLNESTFAQALREQSKRAIKTSKHIEHQSEQERFLLVPLGADLNACFFLAGKQDTLDLAHDSVMLFAGFARQIGKALKRSQLEDALNRSLEQQNARLEEELQAIKTGLTSSALVYRSEVMQNIVNQTQRAAQTDTTILVTGESGTGKEKLIHAIHNLSPRNKAPLIIVDCGAIPETLIESELFGYVKGAFTGAQNNSVGKIQAADGGILVLDEIGELPMSMQPKLLRFVQEKQFTPVGGNKAVYVDVKIVAVTNRDLAKEVERGRFRQDLYFRLNVVSLHSPALRARPEDIELLAQHFLTKFATQFETTRKFLSPPTLEKMRSYHWPGNIRELENKLMQASLLCQGDEISFDDINIELHQSDGNNTQEQDILGIDSRGDGLTHIDSNPRQSKTATSHNIDVNIGADEPQVMSATADKDEWLRAYDKAVDKLVAQVCASEQYYHSELGDWIESSLFQFTYQSCRTNKLIAARLQIPISTARRKANKANTMEIKTCPPAWQQVTLLLQQLARGEVLISKPLDTLKMHLLSTILKKNPNNMTHAAQLLGVSEPTLYKLKRKLQ